jgi:hypothetical protein
LFTKHSDRKYEELEEEEVDEDEFIEVHKDKPFAFEDLQPWQLTDMYVHCLRMQTAFSCTPLDLLSMCWIKF